MTSQAPSSNTPNYIDLGNAIVSVGLSGKTTFALADSATDWRRLGVMKAGVQFDMAKESQDVMSGSPQKLVKRFYTKETIKVSGELLEITPFNLQHALGELPITTTLKTLAPAPTTVASTSTKIAIKVASIVGYAKDQIIAVGAPGLEQFGTVKSTAAGTLNLYEGLSGDTVPTVGQPVSAVATQKMALGTIAAPTPVSLKIVKTMTGGSNGTITLYVLNALAEGNVNLSWSDNGQTDFSSIPFSFECMADPDVEAGALAQAMFTW